MSDDTQEQAPADVPTVTDAVDTTQVQADALAAEMAAEQAEDTAPVVVETTILANGLTVAETEAAASVAGLSPEPVIDPRPADGDEVLFVPSLGAAVVPARINKVWGTTCVNLDIGASSVFVWRPGMLMPAGHVAGYADEGFADAYNETHTPAAPQMMSSTPLSDVQVAAVDETVAALEPEVPGEYRLGHIRPDGVVVEASGVPTEVFPDPDAPGRKAHQEWCEERIANGWGYGPDYCERNRRHPNLVAFEMLPQAVRDAYAAGTV
jgi:hypothetical protein